MTNPVAAQDRCPLRIDLDRGLRLIADDPQHTRIFTQNAYGVSERPVDADGQPSHFEELSWLTVNAPHAILPGVFDGPKGHATVTYYMDSFYADTSSGYDPVFQVNALFDDLLSSMIEGQIRTFDISVDQGSWRMFGMAFWNKSDGVINVTYLGKSVQSPQVIGSCSYDTFSYRTQLQVGGQTLLFQDVHYAPDLGLVLGRTPLNQDGTPKDSFWFSGIAFE
ncbi:hypothetical protein [Yoonia sp. SDW83-1]|uniref:hypothetical protein n=1 Tax=Yoonia sp. SDW83-1 TaxID=3366945 RepID=UPI00398C264B